MAVTVRPTGQVARAGLWSAGWLAAAGVGLSLTKLTTGWGLPCPWRALTGTLCPMCGATTLGTHLLRGDLGAAWQANPAVFVLLVIGAVAVVAWVVEVLGGPALRPPAHLRSTRMWGAVLAIALLGFAAWRNLA